MRDSRTCPICGEPIHRPVGESPSKYAKRASCGKSACKAEAHARYWRSDLAKIATGKKIETRRLKRLATAAKGRNTGEAR